MAHFQYPQAMRRLINELTRLPTIGEKSATRLAYHLLMSDRDKGAGLAKAIAEAALQTRLCENCFALSDEAICGVCADAHRDHGLICAVEKPMDVIAIERSGGYRGLFHVLHGLWSPLRGIGPEQTRIGELVERVKNAAQGETPIREVILATGTTVEGDATAMYIANALSEFGVKTSRIAQGLPKGGELEYADDVTLSHALEGRKGLSL